MIQQALEGRCLLRHQIIFRASARRVQQVEHVVRVRRVVIPMRKVHHDGLHAPIFIRHKVAELFHPPGLFGRQQIIVGNVVGGEALLGQHRKGRGCELLRRGPADGKADGKAERHGGQEGEKAPWDAKACESGRHGIPP